MSCFIVEPDNIGNQAEFIAAMLNGGMITNYIAVPESLREVFKDCKQGRQYDAHKIYRMLYIANLRAYNGRYKDENIKEFEKYKKRAVPTDYIKLHKQISCYLYQCIEDPVYKTPIYNAVVDLKNALANMIVESLSEYKDGWR